MTGQLLELAATAAAVAAGAADDPRAGPSAPRVDAAALPLGEKAAEAATWA